MPILRLPLGDLLDAARRPAGAPPWAADGRIVLVVDLDEADDAPLPHLPPGFPGVVVGCTRHQDAVTAAAACDVVVPHDDPALLAVEATVEAHPLASAALASLLRGAEHRSIDEGLLAESAVYSMLQSGPEFSAWRAARPGRDRGASHEPIELSRTGGRLDITLNRPQVRNALDTAMRDALVEAFALPALDPSITEVHLRGAGPAFCSGGDLDEFGSFPDPVTAHLVRLQQSVGRAIEAIADRVTAHLHGACAGSGIELPAFAARVEAAPDTTISLPELSLGLVPGAGGTVSLPRRIGRHRTARLALTGEQLDASTALAWGLVDEVVTPRP